MDTFKDPGCLLNQGSHFPLQFLDLLLIYTGPEQITHFTPISDNLNNYHYGSLFKQILACFSKVWFNFVVEKENQHLIILQNKGTQF